MSTVIPASQLTLMVTDAHERTVELIHDLADTQLMVPHTDVVNPFLWELGHTAFFYDVFLLRILGSANFLLEGADTLYDSFKVDHCDRWGLPLPGREATVAYKARVLKAVLSRLDGHQPDAEETYLHLLSVLHEDMHGEAFTYMRQTLEYPVPKLSIARMGRVRARSVAVHCLGTSTSLEGVFSWARHPICPSSSTTRNGPIR